MAPLSPNLEAARPRLPEPFDPSAKGSDVRRFVATLEIYFEAIGCSTPQHDASRIRLAATLSRWRTTRSTRRRSVLEGVHVDPRKIEAVKKWKVPENMKELQQFLGFTNYYNRFVPQYAKIAAPLTDLLKKYTPFKWDTPHQQAMEQLHTALTTTPVLILPDPKKDYVVEADASDQAVGAVLMQDHGNGLQPIAYLSKKLHGAELNYPIHDKEALAIVVAFKAWRCYLEGAKTTVYTDHYSLKYLKSQPTLSRRQVRWVDLLETHFHYDIIYKPGLHNKADALSRPGHVAGIQLDGMNPLLKGLFQHGYSVDGEIAMAEKQKLLQWEKDLAILLEEFHDVPYAGHFGSNKTFAGIAKYYYWPRMAADVQQFVTSCDTCQRMKSSKHKKTGLLQPLPVPEQPWQVVSLDFITGLPSTSRGHDSILVVIDNFSKMGHFIPTNATATAEATARLFFDRIITIHGIPATLISDRDPKFTSNTAWAGRRGSGRAAWLEQGGAARRGSGRAAWRGAAWQGTAQAAAAAQAQQRAGSSRAGQAARGQQRQRVSSGRNVQAGRAASTESTLAGSASRATRRVRADDALAAGSALRQAARVAGSALG
ncbi:unnamed protein product [Closterium sp. NIES-53]